jgi:hypothetical protein
MARRNGGAAVPGRTNKCNHEACLQVMHVGAEVGLERGQGLRSLWPLEGSHAAELPLGVYEAKLKDPHLQFLFLHHRAGQHQIRLPPASQNAVSFRIMPADSAHQAGVNRFNFLPHSHAVDKMYTDNSAQAFVGQGGDSDAFVAYNIYTRRKPLLEVLLLQYFFGSMRSLA